MVDSKKSAWSRHCGPEPDPAFPFCSVLAAEHGELFHDKQEELRIQNHFAILPGSLGSDRRNFEYTNVSICRVSPFASIFHIARLLHSVYPPIPCFCRHGTLWEGHNSITPLTGSQLD
jgi:hypothetical protein